MTRLILTAPNLAQAEGLLHGFSTRTGGVSTCYRAAGDLNLGYTAHDDPSNVRQNRTLFLQTLGATDFHHFALLQQKHTPDIRILKTLDQASSDFLPPATQPGDGLVTDLPGVLLTIQTADCIPVLLYDPVHRAIAAFHAGWRGTLARIVEHGVTAMRDHYGSKPEDILAAIGPGIGPRSYAVSQDIRDHFESEFAYGPALFTTADGPAPVPTPAGTQSTRRIPVPGAVPGPVLYLDLWQSNRQQLLSAGLPGTNIDVLAQDTATDTVRFFSHRAEHGFTGRLMSAIGLA